MATDVVKQIRRRTRRKFSADEKIRIVLEGLRGEIPITERCRQQGIQPSIYYKWSKAFLDAGKNGLTRDTHRDATSQEVRRVLHQGTVVDRLPVSPQLMILPGLPGGCLSSRHV